MVLVGAAGDMNIVQGRQGQTIRAAAIKSAPPPRACDVASGRGVGGERLPAKGIVFPVDDGSDSGLVL